MKRKYGKFNPKQNHPVALPLHTNDPGETVKDPHGMAHHWYKNIAWDAYWKMVHKTAKKHKLRLWAAHQKLQKDHPFPAPDMGDKDYTWGVDEFILLFMWQFEGWENKTYDMDKRCADEDGMKYFKRMASHHRVASINAQTSLEDAFELFLDDTRNDFVESLYGGRHKHLLEQIVDDPIFGHNAKYDLLSIARSQQFEIDELFRKAALPENVIQIDEIIKHAGPTNYTAFFPYPPNQWHNVPNCLCVLGDGGAIFRLEVLDPPVCSRFKLAELKDPWWGQYAPLLTRPEPGEGQYDFPFYDFDLKEGDEFGLDKLFEVLRCGVEQINVRTKFSRA